MPIAAATAEARSERVDVTTRAVNVDALKPCTIIGTANKVPAGDATFANAVAGHGLVREDMHTGSVSHLGVVVLPPLLALAQEQCVDGRAFTAAAVIGYEVGACIGRALVTPEFTRTFRPTAFTGPLASAAACSHLLNADAEVTASALALAANMPPWKGQLDETTIWQITAYILSLRNAE